MNMKATNERRAVSRAGWCVALGSVLSGCGPDFRQLRMEGQSVMLHGNYAAARGLFHEAHRLKPEDPFNLHDLGVCCVHFAHKQILRRNFAAAQRELDNAIAYYDRSITAHPGFQAALEGKNVALELKGHFDEALTHADWARRVVGPSARQHLFLAREFEERGDTDSAMLRYRQAAAMEPDNPAARKELGLFWLRAGHRDEAVRELMTAFRLNPQTPGVVSTLTSLGVSLPRLKSKD